LYAETGDYSRTVNVYFIGAYKKTQAKIEHRVKKIHNVINNVFSQV